MNSPDVVPDEYVFVIVTATGVAEIDKLFRSLTTTANWNSPDWNTNPYSLKELDELAALMLCKMRTPVFSGPVSGGRRHYQLPAILQVCYDARYIALYTGRLPDSFTPLTAEQHDQYMVALSRVAFYRFDKHARRYLNGAGYYSKYNPLSRITVAPYWGLRRPMDGVALRRFARRRKRCTKCRREEECV